MKYTFEVKDENYLAHYGKKGMKWGKRKKKTKQPKVKGIVSKEYGTLYIDENDYKISTNPGGKYITDQFTPGTKKKLRDQGLSDNDINALIRKLARHKVKVPRQKMKD